MAADDDPERRIRDLEVAAHGEAAESRPGTALRAGWFVLAVMVLALAAGGVVLLARQADRPVTGTPVADSGEVPRPVSIPVARPPAREPAEPSPPPPGAGPITVAGVETTRTIACDGRAAAVSGVGNIVDLSGRCTRVDVSGVNNQVTVEIAASIVVSGLSNRVRFRSGNPDVDNSGVGNTVERG